MFLCLFYFRNTLWPKQPKTGEARASDKIASDRHNRGLVLIIFGGVVLVIIIVVAGALFVYKRHQTSTAAARAEADAEDTDDDSFDVDRASNSSNQWRIDKLEFPDPTLPLSRTEFILHLDKTVLDIAIHFLVYNKIVKL